MKKIILLSFLSAMILLCQAQTKGSAKLYAFQEPVTKGRSPGVVVDESGKQTPHTPSSSYNYLVYLSSPSRVYPSEMWIKGQGYSVSMVSVTTPVERENDLTIPATKKLLVPKSNGRVIKLSPLPMVDGKQSAKGKRLSADNDLVVVYKQGSKFYYQTIKRFTTLEAASMQ